MTAGVSATMMLGTSLTGRELEASSLNLCTACVCLDATEDLSLIHISFPLGELVDSDAIVKNQATNRRDSRNWCNVPHRVRCEFQEVEVIENIDISSAIQSEISD